MDRNLLPEESDYRKVGFGTAAKYTMVQVGHGRLLWWCLLVLAFGVL